MVELVTVGFGAGGLSFSICVFTVCSSSAQRRRIPECLRGYAAAGCQVWFHESRIPHSTISRAIALHG